MPVIETYSFGRMVIEAVLYTRDLIIFPDNRIVSPWWRIDGHLLVAADLTDLIATRPAVIIAGTGASGFMRPADDLTRLCAELSLDFIALPTGDAVREFNRLAGSKRIGGCFHLTC